MIQLYFLSILCNGLSGYLLFTGNENETAEKSRLMGPTFNLALGILSAVVGVLKLLSPTLETTFFFGDLLPATGGIAAGYLLIFGIYRQDSFSTSPPQGTLDKFGVNLLRFRKFIGLGLIAVAVLHFIFAKIIFL
jgi:hypothetical protein